MGTGALIFKGEKPRKTKNKRSKHKAHAVVTKTRGSGAWPPSANREENEERLSTEAKSASVNKPQIRSGTGKITSSGTVVTGHGTRFLAELRVGDAVMVDDQMRVVTMCLSNTSINLSSALSSSIKSPVAFRYIQKPRNERSEQRARERRELQDKTEEQSRAAGVYAEEEKLVYREKTASGSYRIRKEALDGDVSRTDLVEMRSKKKHDKYC